METEVIDIAGARITVEYHPDPATGTFTGLYVLEYPTSVTDRQEIKLLLSDQEVRTLYEILDRVCNGGSDIDQA